MVAGTGFHFHGFFQEICLPFVGRYRRQSLFGSGIAAKQSTIAAPENKTVQFPIVAPPSNHCCLRKKPGSWLVEARIVEDLRQNSTRSRICTGCWPGKSVSSIPGKWFRPAARALLPFHANHAGQKIPSLAHPWIGRVLCDCGSVALYWIDFRPLVN